MKKTIGIVGGFALTLMAVSANAQNDTAMPVTTTTTTVKTWEAKNNPTVDSINAKYRDRMVASRAPLTADQIFPALGEFESTNNPDASHVMIEQDATNKGVVWITGLPQGKIKAMLRQGPSTYKIPAQKNEEGKDVAEGTLIFDRETNTLNILIGKEFDVANPSSAFAVASEPQEQEKVIVKDGGKKTKVKKVKAPPTWSYTGTKIVKETATLGN